KEPRTSELQHLASEADDEGDGRDETADGKEEEVAKLFTPRARVADHGHEHGACSDERARAEIHERFIDTVHSSIGGREACDRRGESEIQNPEADEAHVSEAHEPSPPGRVASEPVGAVEEEALRCACEQAREDRRPTERVEEIAHASCLLREARREAAIL